LGKNAINEPFLSLFDPKSAFFEAFLGVKKRKNAVLNRFYVPEIV